MALSEPGDSRPHAPKLDSGCLLPLSLASLVSGLAVLGVGVMFRVSGSAATPNADQVALAAWLFPVLGAALTLMAGVTLVLRAAQNPDLGAELGEALAPGQERSLGESLRLLVRVYLANRQARLVANVLVMVLLSVTLLVLVNYVFARHELFRLDLTSQRLYSLSPESTALARSLQKDVKLVIVLPRSATDPQQQDLLERLQALGEQYRAASSRIEVELLDPTRVEHNELTARLADLQLAGMPLGAVLGAVVQSGVRTADGWQRDQTKHIPLADFWRSDPGADLRDRSRLFVGEQKLSGAIREVAEGEPAVVYFVTGHEERSIGGFDENGVGTLAQLLRQRNFKVEQLAFDPTKPDVPADAAALVVAGPERAFTQAELDAVQRYLDGGGDAILMLEAVLEARSAGTEFLPTGLEALLESEFAVQCDDRLIFVTYPQGVDHELILQSFHPTSPITRPLEGAKVAFASARPLLDQPKVKVVRDALAETPPNWARCWATADPARIYRDHRLPEVRLPGPFKLVLSVEKAPTKRAAGRGPDDNTRLVVFGDVDWAANRLLSSPALQNFELFLNSLNWAIQREYNVTDRAPRPTSYRLEMSNGEVKFFKLAACPGMPLFALVLGLVAWALRRRG